MGQTYFGTLVHGHRPLNSPRMHETATSDFYVRSLKIRLDSHHGERKDDSPSRAPTLLSQNRELTRTLEFYCKVNFIKRIKGKIIVGNV
jgi:hypothetical protein